MEPAIIALWCAYLHDTAHGNVTGDPFRFLDIRYPSAEPSRMPRPRTHDRQGAREPGKGDIEVDARNVTNNFSSRLYVFEVARDTLH
jgi:hypothetical protein